MTGIIFFGQVKLSLLLKGVKKNPSSLPGCNILIDFNTETTQNGEFVELVNVCDFVYKLMFISQVQWCLATFALPWFKVLVRLIRPNNWDRDNHN